VSKRKSLNSLKQSIDGFLMLSRGNLIEEILEVVSNIFLRDLV